MTAGIARVHTTEITHARLHGARHVLLLAVLLGVVADTVLRLAPGGLGWLLWMLASAGAVLYLARHLERPLAREPLAWLGVAVACAALFAWRDAEQLRVASLFGTLVAVALFSMTAAGVPATSIGAARVRDVLAGGLFAVLDLIAGAPVLLTREATLHTLPVVRGGASWSALRAFVLTAPIVFVFTLLLSRADPVFASLFALPTLDPERIITHVIITGAFAWWSAGWMRGALLGSRWRAAPPPQLPVRLGMVEVSTSLGAVIVLFAVFVALQLRWLFGGAEVVLATTGLTVAEYARRGFFELVVVTLLVLPLILTTHALAANDAVARRHRQLASGLAALLAAIIASALLRMRLYVAYFGLTTDRLYATVLMVWLAVILVALALTVLRGRSRPFAAAAVLSGFATLLVLNAMNPERVVARVNLGRAPGATGIDWAYLARLSGDAAPDVARALVAEPPSPVACKAAQSMRARWLRNDDASSNLGARQGRAAVLDALTEGEVQRLCSGGGSSGAS